MADLHYFWHAGCGPCRSMSPQIDSLRVPGVRVVKHDVTTMQGHQTAATLGVQGTPTMILAANNAELARHMGSVANVDQWVRQRLR
jgi:thioredoxin-like negative regulator of GroEL